MKKDKPEGFENLELCYSFGAGEFLEEEIEESIEKYGNLDIFSRGKYHNAKTGNHPHQWWAPQKAIDEFNRITRMISNKETLIVNFTDHPDWCRNIEPKKSFGVYKLGQRVNHGKDIVKIIHIGSAPTPGLALKHTILFRLLLDNGASITGMFDALSKPRVYYKEVTVSKPHCPECNSVVSHGRDLTHDEKTMYTYKCDNCGYLQ